MSVKLRPRLLARPGTLLTLSGPTTLRRQPMPQTPHRTVFSWLRRRRPPPLDPLSAEFLNRRPTAPLPPSIRPGDLSPSSIFDTGPGSSAAPATAPRQASGPAARRQRDPNLMAAALDPTPTARRRWERKMVIRSITRRHRLSRTVQILRTERAHRCKSPFFATSVKKLFPLARQIAGKPIDEAIVQMRFSRKKVAAEVLKHLEYARDEAIVKRGMGLGMVGVEKGGAAAAADEAGKVTVIDKKGKRRVVSDRTAMYVDEAWVGRGEKRYGYDYRARGKLYRLHNPSTSITVVLKEEATRIRLQKERLEKRARKKVWVPLPDRPITAQRQYCMW